MNITAGEKMFIVSACLAGVDCRHDGSNCADPLVQQLVKQGKAIPVCPEQLGGLETPRMSAEIHGGDGGDVLERKAQVIRKDGTDITDCFLKGAYETLKVARLAGARQAIMKSCSPSCGCGKIYDGTFSGNKINGNGVTTELLIRNGIEVKTDK
jgi:uncharacterized protein YbbK (DUF523 family)